MIRIVVRNICVLSALAAVALSGHAAAPASAGSLPTARAHEALLLDIARAGQRLVAVGERGHIVVSADNGTSWKQASVPTRALLTTVFFLDDRRGWAVGHDSTVLRTDDAGDTWVLQYQAHFDQAEVDAEYDAQAAAADAAMDDSLGQEETRIASRAQRIGAALMGVHFVDGKRGIAVGAYGLLLSTEDGGAHWQDRSELVQNPEGWHLNGITALPSAPATLYVVGEKGLAFVSTNAGTSFVRANVPVESSLFGVFGYGSSAYAYGLQGRLFRSTLGGPWQSVDTGVTFGLNDATALASGGLVFVGNAGTVVTIGSDGKATSVRRHDGKAVMAAEATGDGLVLVGENGVKPARIDGSKP